jgi:hypothetical protein
MITRSRNECSGVNACIRTSNIQDCNLHLYIRDVVQGQTHSTISYEKTGHQTHNFLMIAAVNSEVVAAPGKVEHVLLRKKNIHHLPPISAVRTSPELMTSNVALAMLLAIESRLWRNLSDCRRRRGSDLP